MTESSRRLHELLRDMRRPGAGLLSRLPGIVYQCRTDDRRTMEFLDGAVRELTGYEPDQIVQNRDVGFLDLVHPEDRERLMEAVSWKGDDPHEYEVEYRIRAAGGEERWLWERGHGVFSEKGELLGLEGFIEDISGLRRIEEEKRAANRLLGSVLDQSLVGVFVLQAGGFTYVNRKMTEILDKDAGTLLDHANPVRLLALEDRPLVEERFVALLEGRERETRVAVRARGSADRLLNLAIHASAAEIEGEPAVIGTVLDVTDRLAIERQYREAQKLESIARMASGIAHDFNNLLTAITGTARLAIERVAREDPEVDVQAVLTDFDDILTAARQEAYLTRQLLAFSRRGDDGAVTERRVVDLNRVLREGESLVRRVVADRITVDVRTAPIPLHVAVDIDQIHQILLNLVMNAEDAMPRGGVVTVSVESVDPDEVPTVVHELGREGPWCRLAVTDMGPGVPDERKEKIFEPFFTTKERGKGTGLGLSSAYGIGRDHGGLLMVEDDPGGGAAFQLYLPTVAPSAALPEESHTLASQASEGSETVLLVDDDPAVRRVLARTLTRYGYESLEAGTPEAAMLLAGRNAGRIDLLVTDVGLPQMRGSDLARAVRDLIPDVPVLLISGYSASELEARGIGSSSWHFLEKPFDPVTLADRVRQILDSEGDHPMESTS